MTTFDRDSLFDQRISDWLETDPDHAPGIVLETVTAAFPSIQQRRASRVPWRFPTMPMPARVATAAVLGVLVIGGALYTLGPSHGSVGGSGPTPSPSPTAAPSPTPPPTALRQGPLPAGTYVTAPFAGPDKLGLCYGQAECAETAADDTIRITFTVTDGWEGGAIPVVWNSDLAGVGLVFERGGSFYVEPCGDQPPPNIPVGPTVADFVSELTSHPKLDVTPPVDVTLDGYHGKYVDLQVPADISACPQSYLPWEPGLYAQGPGNRWHLWVLDVDGVRVVIQTLDYATTPPEVQAKLKAMVDSIQIEP